MKSISLNQKTGELLLAAVIVARATSFLFSKVLLQSMEPMTLMAVRFLTAFAFLFLLFHQKLRHLSVRTLLHGMLLGGTFFSVMSAELSSLRTTPSSAVSFLENTAIVFVPVLECILHKKFPRIPTVLSLTITMAGIALLTTGGLSFSMQSGELLALLAAFLLETPRLPSDSMEWGCILMLAFVCSGFGFTLQPVAQSHTTAERASMLCALSPAAAAVLGHIFLKESFGIGGLVGILLILSGILFSSVAKSKP